MAAERDELLVIRCQLGEAGALEDLVTRWQTPVWRYIVNLLPGDEDAGDVAQEVWLAVLRGLGRLREPAAFAPWLFVVARRAVITRLRRRYALKPEVPLESNLDVADESAADIHTPSIPQDVLDRALAALPIVEREVLTMFYLDELSLAEMAQVLEVPLGTVKSRLFRARRLLRSTLEGLR